MGISATDRYCKSVTQFCDSVIVNQRTLMNAGVKTNSELNGIIKETLHLKTEDVTNDSYLALTVKFDGKETSAKPFKETLEKTQLLGEWTSVRAYCLPADIEQVAYHRLQLLPFITRWSLKVYHWKSSYEEQFLYQMFYSTLSAAQPTDISKLVDKKIHILKPHLKEKDSIKDTPEQNETLQVSYLSLLPSLIAFFAFHYLINQISVYVFKRCFASAPVWVHQKIAQIPMSISKPIHFIYQSEFISYTVLVLNNLVDQVPPTNSNLINTAKKILNISDILLNAHIQLIHSSLTFMWDVCKQASNTLKFAINILSQGHIKTMYCCWYIDGIAQDWVKFITSKSNIDNGS